MKSKVKFNMEAWAFSIFCLMLVFSCQQELADEVKEASAQSALMLEYPKVIQDKINSIKKEHPDAEFLYIETEPNSLEKLLEEYNKQGFKSTYFEVVKNEESSRVGILMEKSSRVAAMISNLQHEGEVFTVVEQPPVPEGGLQQLYRFISREMRYPEEARQSGIGGKVFVEFIIDKDGLVKDIRTVKGIGYGCDEEAERVLTGMPAWQPGMQRGQAVAVKMILPITFALNVEQKGSEAP
ncbi:MAG: energy transducer TonB [Cyclobacteriaceae bacterium]|nr:energy transducer TonB [Cyclobacteriaceae bacterium]